MLKRRVIYHANCPDGFGAAWAVWRALGDEDTIYEPWQYGQEPPRTNLGTEMILVDFSFKRMVMEGLIANSGKFLCLDHHKTAQAELQGLPYCEFDMHESGATMAWDAFHQQPRPWLIDYVRDRDLWLWELPNSREVSAWVMAQRHDFGAWSRLCDEGQHRACEMGTAIRIHIRHYCEAMAKAPRLGLVGGRTMPVVNAPMFNVSDLLHHICEGQADPTYAAACAWWVRNDGRVQHSLRSIGDFDVSEIAKSYGGGGHRNAAGFEAKHCVAEFV